MDKHKDEYAWLYGDDDEGLIEEKIESIKGAVQSGECIFCGAPGGMEREETRYEKIFVCETCGGAIDEERYLRWTLGYLSNGELEELRGYPAYEDVYDEEGNEVLCDHCGKVVMWKDGKYECPWCGRVYDRSEFLSMIGSSGLGPKCLTCNNLYPGCISCPYGYVEDDK